MLPLTHLSSVVPGLTGIAVPSRRVVVCLRRRSPGEFKDAKAAGQVKDSPYKFTRAHWSRPLIWLAEGCANYLPSSLPCCLSCRDSCVFWNFDADGWSLNGSPCQSWEKATLSLMTHSLSKLLVSDAWHAPLLCAPCVVLRVATHFAMAHCSQCVCCRR